MIYLTANGLTSGGSSTVHFYTQTIHRTTQSTQKVIEQHSSQMGHLNYCQIGIFSYLCSTTVFRLQSFT